MNRFPPFPDCKVVANSEVSAICQQPDVPANRLSRCQALARHGPPRRVTRSQHRAQRQPGVAALLTWPWPQRRGDASSVEEVPPTGPRKVSCGPVPPLWDRLHGRTNTTPWETGSPLNKQELSSTCQPTPSLCPTEERPRTHGNDPPSASQQRGRRPPGKLGTPPGLAARVSPVT